MKNRIAVENLLRASLAALVAASPASAQMLVAPVRLSGAPVAPAVTALPAMAAPSSFGSSVIALPAISGPVSFSASALVTSPVAAAVSATAVPAMAKAVAAMPDLGKASASDASGAGRNLEAAMTGESFLSGSGAVFSAAGETPSAPPFNSPFASGASAELIASVAEKSKVIARVSQEVGKVIVGQAEMVQSIVMGMIAGEHVLLEGLPGVAKTQTVKAFADSVKGDFKRVQGTPDKLPSDIIGAEVLQEDPQTGAKAIKLEKGPVFTSILLVDEINRMMPKTQSSLLEAMAEGRVTVGRQTLELPKPFLVLATQNPIEQEGTYRLPEAQQDRFMLKVIVGRPNMGEMKEIMSRNAKKDGAPKAETVTTLDELVEVRKVAEQVYVDEAINEYIVNIVEATHEPGAYGLDMGSMIDAGASPRAAIYLLKSAKIHALLQGRAYVTPEDVRAVAHRVLRHRILMGYRAQDLTTDQVVDRILGKVEVPKPRIRSK